MTNKSLENQKKINAANNKKVVRDWNLQKGPPPPTPLVPNLHHIEAVNRALECPDNVVPFKPKKQS